MNKLLNNIVAKENENNIEENLFVKNIIVNKQKNVNPNIPYIATERWIDQLGSRLEIS